VYGFVVAGFAAVARGVFVGAWPNTVRPPIVVTAMTAAATPTNVKLERPML
jgi:hypothetical protein